jgi:putative membrane protein
MTILRLIICGILVGGGAILPGLSGGVLCVAFGIYQPMMELLSHPRAAIKKHIKMFIPVGIGFVAGFFLFSKIIVVLFGASELYTTWLFIGLIVGTVPSLFRQAGIKGRNGLSWIWFGVGFILMFLILGVVASGIIKRVEPNIYWYIFCGLLWGLSIIVPGMSSSSMLISMDLYEPLNAGVANLDMGVIIPWSIGIIATVLFLARLVSFFLNKHYSPFFHAVLGIVLASTVLIIPLKGYESAASFIISAALFIGGAVGAWYMEKLDPGISEVKGNKEE